MDARPSGTRNPRLAGVYTEHFSLGDIISAVGSDAKWHGFSGSVQLTNLSQFLFFHGRAGRACGNNEYLASPQFDPRTGTGWN